MSHTLYLGIDVAKDSFDVASEPAGLARSFPNDATGRRRLVETLQNQPVALIVLEATGGYERDLVAALLDAGHKVVVANPRQVRDFARGLGQLAKTDRLDAQVLARFAALVKPEPRQKAPEQVAQLAELVTRRRQLSDLLTQESNRLPHARHPQVQKSLRKSLRALERQIEDLDQLIRQNIDSDDDLRRKDEIVQSFKGVGPGTSAMLQASGKDPTDPTSHDFLGELLNRNQGGLQPETIVAAMAGPASDPSQSVLRKTWILGATEIILGWTLPPIEAFIQVTDAKVNKTHGVGIPEDPW